MRSQTGVNWTAVNVSMQELMRRFGRTELQTYIAHFLAGEFKFVRYADFLL